MRRSIEGWLILLITAPLLMWGVIKISVWLLSVILGTPMAFGKPIPSLAEIVLFWLFAAPVAAGAYHYVTQSDRRKQLGASVAMIGPPALLFAIQLIDRSAQSISARAWLMDTGLLVALLVGLAAYVWLTLHLARLLASWQSMHG